LRPAHDFVHDIARRLSIMMESRGAEATAFRPV
jgi:hypothetical protein